MSDQPNTSSGVEASEEEEPREVSCKFCGTVTVRSQAELEDHLRSESHRLAQVQSLKPRLVNPGGQP